MVIVPKLSSEWRFCVNNRALNNVTVRDSHPMPRIDDSLDFFVKGKLHQHNQSCQGLLQVGVEEGSRPKTVFTSHSGLFQFRVMSFGLCNAPTVFQWLMNVLAGLIYKCCAVFLYDIVVVSPTFKQHLDDLREVFSHLRSAGLTVKLGKCQFCQEEFKFLGYKVMSGGISPDET